MKKFLLTGILLAFVVAPITAWADSISPATYSDTLAVGESVTITKTVTVDDAPPTSAPVDVLFLADTTGSMCSAIANVKAGAASIMSSVAGLGDVQFAAAEYKDIYDTYTWKVNSSFTSSTATTQGGINQWYASGGGDGPEGQMIALTDLANNADDQYGNSVDWRDDSTRILLWIADYY